MQLEELIYIHNQYQDLKRQADKLQQDINQLEAQGLVEAKPYWIRKDDPDGKPDQLELTHSTNSDYYKQHNTRREYIGVKPQKIKAVLAGIDRFYRHRDLRYQAQRLNRQITTVEMSFRQLRANVFAKQSNF